MTELPPQSNPKADELITAYHTGQLTRQQFLQQAKVAMWVVIAAFTETDRKSIRLQDFLQQDGRSFVPVFSSEAVFDRLSRGITILPGYRVFELRGDYIFPWLIEKGAWILINPSEPTEISLKPDEA